MFRRIAPVVALVALVAVSCSSQEPLQGIDLPPASVPDSIVSGAWAVRFTHEFPPGAWEEGNHVYALALACDVVLDEPVRTEPIDFVVAPGELLDQVYLRVVGLSHDTTGPPSVGGIDPQQSTTAALTIVGVSEEAATEAQSCAGAIFYDDEDPLPLMPEPPFRP